MAPALLCRITSPDPTPVTIITGAGSGIGAALALRLAARGHRLAIAGRRLRALQLTAQRLAHPDSHLLLPTDVADRQSCANLIDRTLSTFGRIDNLINNAAIVHVAPLQEHTASDLARLYGANAIGPAQLMALCFRLFTQNAPAPTAPHRRGTIVNISSIATSDPLPGLFAYAATKAALEMHSRIAFDEGRPLGIACYCVAPGSVETPMLDAVRSVRPDLRTATALNPDDIARAIESCLDGSTPPTREPIRITSS